MLSTLDINSLSGKELEARIYALPDDAGAFTIPQVRRIVAKVLAEAHEELEKEAVKEKEDLASIRTDLRALEEELADIRRAVDAAGK